MGVQAGYKVLTHRVIHTAPFNIQKGKLQFTFSLSSVPKLQSIGVIKAHRLSPLNNIPLCVRLYNHLVQSRRVQQWRTASVLTTLSILEAQIIILMIHRSPLRTGNWASRVNCIIVVHLVINPWQWSVPRCKDCCPAVVECLQRCPGKPWGH